MIKRFEENSVAETAMGPVFTCFSEVSPELQIAFIEEMGLPHQGVPTVANYLQASCPFPFALAELRSDSILS